MEANDTISARQAMDDGMVFLIIVMLLILVGGTAHGVVYRLQGYKPT